MGDGACGDYGLQLGAKARAAARVVAKAATDAKNAALLNAARNIESASTSILEVNAQDIEAAKASGTSPAFLDRMTLTPSRLDAVARALRDIAEQDDPIGEVISAWSRPNGLSIERVRTPLGVVGVIYESRPNVTIDAAAICLKAGSAVILRGGSDCLATALALHACFADGLRQAGLPRDASQIVTTRDRAIVGEMLGGFGGAVDLVIPRGGKSLVARVQSEARVPVLSHLDGICHVYIDKAADPDKAVAITVNAKMRRPGICGAAETLLVDRAVAPTLLGDVAKALQKAGCRLRGDDEACALVDGMEMATEEDWGTEYLDTILSVRVVDGVAGAIEHIATYGSGHTEAIITEDDAAAAAFLSTVDSAIVMHNASTQFADGGEFGLGAEIGIATGKLHVRGPVGVKELTTFKNIVRAEGAIRA